MPTKKLRIAFATPEYITENHFDGGLANYLSRVSRILANLGHDVHVVTLSPIDEAEFEHEGVMVHRVMLKRGWPLLNRSCRRITHRRSLVIGGRTFDREVKTFPREERKCLIRNGRFPGRPALQRKPANQVS